MRRCTRNSRPDHTNVHAHTHACAHACTRMHAHGGSEATVDEILASEHGAIACVDAVVPDRTAQVALGLAYALDAAVPDRVARVG